MKAYATYHLEQEIVKKSSSGGVFTAITDKWMEQYEDSTIYGCVLDDNLNAVHVRAVEKETRNKMRGSKYIASNTVGIYENVKMDIENKKHVLFSGTPCQIANLYSYLNFTKVEYHENLLTIEVICHGVGSNKFFRDYIKHLEKKYKSRAIKCSFRAKSKPDKKEDMQILFENGRKYTASTTKYDWFFSAYMGNYILRPACYSCKFACEDRHADISLSDLWGKLSNREKTKSLVFVNTEKGRIWFDKCSDVLEIETLSMKDVHQPHIHHPSSKPIKYEEFMKTYHDGGFLEAQKYLGNNTTKGKIRSVILNIANRLCLIDVAKKILRKN